jgi:hypothetical protein
MDCFVVVMPYAEEISPYCRQHTERRIGAHMRASADVSLSYKFVLWDAPLPSEMPVEQMPPSNAGLFRNKLSVPLGGAGWVDGGVVSLFVLALTKELATRPICKA